ncbi:MAG: hypothetical protein SFV15_12500 [Polyangiaceae bacterium]|nr:hypothetical protein [Polyangiaceae bacterium]
MPSENRGFSLIVAALLVVLGIGQVRGASESTQAKATTTPSPTPVTASTPSSSGSSEVPLVAAKVKAPATCTEALDVLESYRTLYRQPGAKGVFQFLVVLAPDPEDSGHTDYFDAVMEGVEEAAAAGTLGHKDGRKYSRRFVKDHHYFPWPGSSASKRSQRCWEKTPGVVLYRPVNDPQSEQALALLVVGETPTWGVQAQQLSTAFSWIDEDSPLTEYRILGPTFSGSADSLAAMIRQQAAARRAQATPPLPNLNFHIASGTATGINVKQTLDSLSQANLGFTIEYRTSVPSYDILLVEMLRFLASTNGGLANGPNDTALLTESMTAYGENVRRSNAHPLRNIPQFGFPPNLESLRRAYSGIDQTATPAIRAPSSARTTPEEQRGELSDQTPISHDLALAELLGKLKQNQVRNVGIVATGARDVVFMAERIKRQLPDVRLFTIGLDIRYLHPDHADVLNGMVVAHAAPEVSGHNSAAQSTVLENPMSRGVAGAARHLLAQQPLSRKVQLSLLSNGTQFSLTPGLKVPAIPRTFRAVYWLSLVVFGLISLAVTVPALLLKLTRLKERIACLEGVMRSSFVRQRSNFWSTLGNCDHLDLAADHAFATATLLTTALAVPALMAAATLRVTFTLANAMIFGTIVAITLGLAWWKTRGYWSRKNWQAWTLGAGAGSAACLGTSLGCAPPREATFHLLSGGSPLLAALLGLAMLLVTAWCWRARLRLLDTFRFGALSGARFFKHMPLPLSQILGKAEQSELGQHERRLLRLLQSPWSAPAVPFIVNVLLIACMGLVVCTKPVLTFEEGFRHWILVGFVCICILPIATSFARILIASQALTRVLGAAACAPILKALRDLPPKLARRLESQLAEGGREVGELRYAVETLAKIGRASTAFASVAKECRELLEAELAYEAGADPSDKNPLESARAPARLADRLLLTAQELASSPSSGPLRNLVVEYQARLVAIFVARYVRQLRLLIPPVLVGSVLAVLMTSLYFVQPRHMISSICFIWVTAMVLGIIAVYLGLARDPVISAIGRTTAGSVTPSWTLAVRVLGVTLVPLASLLASQYPEFAFHVSSLLGAVGRVFQ